MRKILTTLALAVAAGLAALAVTALASATQGDSPSKQHDHGEPKSNDHTDHGHHKRHHKSDRILFASLNGRNEIGTDGRRKAGDLDGRGGFTGLIDDGQVCFGITVEDIDAPVAAHIHRGKPHENGPIVVTLTAPTSGDPGASSGCVPPDGGNTDVLREIAKHSRRFYVNVHTGDFPNGAVRGQLKHKRP
jgi:CHRD domain